jgi:hypothetical protein
VTLHPHSKRIVFFGFEGSVSILSDHSLMPLSEPPQNLLSNPLALIIFFILPC